jgi:hypothetical protein
MKKIITVSLLAMLIVVLTACAAAPSSSQSNFVAPGGDSSGSASQNPAEAPTGSESVSNNPAKVDTSTISDETRLVIGTFKLEGTDQAITKDQAAVLLPLWKTLKEIENKAAPQSHQPQGNQQSNTTPMVNSDIQQLIDAQVKQIQAAMTVDQLQAINNMQLSSQDIMTIMQEQGITLGNPQSGGGDQGNGTTTPPQGTPSAGGAPAGNGGPQGPGSGPSPMGTPQAGARQDGGRLPPGIIDALIQCLQNKAGS